MSSIGHNSVASKELREYIERIEKLEEDKAVLSEDIKDIYTLAKSTGFDPRTMRKIVALRKMDEGNRKEAQSMLELYAHALGLDLV